jgi:hypothetical protein
MLCHHVLVARFRPLSQRENPDPAFDEPREGIPTYLWAPIVKWLHDVAVDNPDIFYFEPVRRTEWMMRLQPVVQVALDWASPATAWEYLLTTMASNHALALDVIDFALDDLGEITHPESTAGQRALEMGEILTNGNSAWRVTVDDGGYASLLRRFVGPVDEALEDVRSASDRAHHHLTDARNKAFGTRPEPTAAWASAVRAVEVVAGSAVTPNDPKPSLWRIVSAIRDKPEKWGFPLGGPLLVLGMLDGLGTTDQRHGTDDPTVPLEATREQAQAAYFLALSLVQIFASGLFTPVS